jgi:two-component system chemotaxis sensor kinase CheA
MVVWELGALVDVRVDLLQGRFECRHKCHNILCQLGNMRDGRFQRCQINGDVRSARCGNRRNDSSDCLRIINEQREFLLELRCQCFAVFNDADVQLVLEGEQTEADKNIIESLADPLIHIVRNSLDHGLETPEVRLAAGKPPTGKLTIRAAQQADRVVIEIIDDGKGIDPAAIKEKAYEKGIIDEATLERIGDQEAINLIFAAGLSTAAVISDLSGRGVGMDVVRSAVEKINGTVLISSEIGKGTTIRISLPLSMAVTQVLIIESDQQLFGVPMDHVIETLRVPRSAIHTIKQSQTAVLRGRIVPLKSLNSLLGIAAIPQANSDDELAVLLVHAGGAELGLLVDGLQETVGVIQKPLNGFLSNLSSYSGSALMGDGSVLMILNIREIV